MREHCKLLALERQRWRSFLMYCVYDNTAWIISLPHALYFFTLTILKSTVFPH